MVSQNLALFLVALGVFLILTLIVCTQCACLGPAYRHLMCGCIDGGASTRAIFAAAEVERKVERKAERETLLPV